MPEKPKDKLASTVLYILRGCAASRPGLTSLLKMVWYTDYWHYQRHLRRVTDADYVAAERGPMIAGYEPLLDRMVTDGLLKVVEVPVQGHPGQPKMEYSPLMEPDESAFSESELEVLRDVIRELGDKNGAELTARTHSEPPWLLTYRSDRPARAISNLAMRWSENLPSEGDIDAAKRALARPEVRAELEALNAA